jgi:hypothetical protein
MRTLLVLLAVGCSGTTSEPRSNTAPGGEQTASDGSYQDHVRKLRAKLRRAGLGNMHIRIEEPFVVVGDGSVASLERSSQTVRWAADKLEQEFFDRRPTKILDIFLFQTAESYEAGVKKLTGSDPGTPYGFYSPSNGAMFMNISTGGGTLVHEIVHPYVEADFPDAPAWLNEGLGSLFEQSAERGGRIVGLTNWRLDGLQRAITRDRVPSFRELTALARDDFYGDQTGTNYAQSRYLMFYLQEQGKLRSFYRAFRAARTNDPTGWKTLVATLGERDMRAFKRRWERFVLDLEYP